MKYVFTGPYPSKTGFKQLTSQFINCTTFVNVNQNVIEYCTLATIL